MIYNRGLGRSFRALACLLKHHGELFVWGMPVCHSFSFHVPCPANDLDSSTKSLTNWAPSSIGESRLECLSSEMEGCKAEEGENWQIYW